MATSENLVGGITILTFGSLDTMQIPEHKGPFPVKVEILEEGKINLAHGGMFLMTQCPLEKSKGASINRLTIRHYLF